MFSGTLIVGGKAIAEVTATGERSEIGRIGKSLGLLEVETPRLQLQMRKLVGVFAAVGGAVSVLVVVLYGLLRGGWLEGLLAGIAVGMSMLPEEFPMVLAVIMAMGAWRISKAGVLTRRAAAIESLGAASVLCTDKTGTLTENRMVIAELRLAGGDTLPIGAETNLQEAFRELADAGALASAPQPFDPMEKAFHTLATRGRCEGQAYPAAGLTLVRSYPLTPELLAMTQVWQDGDGGFLVAAKGAPEAIADLCRLGPAARVAVTTQVDQMAQEGLRVLGVAQA